MLLRALPLIIEIGLLVYCLIDCIQTPSESVRNLAKGWWILLILIFPIIGSIAWLVAGRPQAAGRRAGHGYRGPTSGFPEYERPGHAQRAPDDDPEFLASLNQVNAEHEQTLRQWEEDLRRREEELRPEEDERPQDK